MRCLACGAEMNLMKAVQDDTMPVPGFEHHTFMCSACGDIERRLVFRHVGQRQRRASAGAYSTTHFASLTSPR
jgi:hypothetical protein